MRHECLRLCIDMRCDIGSVVHTDIYFLFVAAHTLETSMAAHAHADADTGTLTYCQRQQRRRLHVAAVIMFSTFRSIHSAAMTSSFRSNEQS